MNRLLRFVVLIGFLFSSQVRAQSIFKFQVPETKQYPKGVSFFCDEGSFLLNAKGNYERPTKLHHNNKWIQVKNAQKQWIDSFEAYNLFFYLHLSMDDMDLSRLRYATSAMLDTMKLRYKLMDEDVIVYESNIRYASFVSSDNAGDTRMRTFTDSSGVFKIGDLVPPIGGFLVISDITVDIPSYKKTKVPGSYLTIVTSEVYDSLGQLHMLYTGLPTLRPTRYATYKRHKSPLPGGYTLLGTTMDDSDALFDAKGDSSEIVQIINSVHLKGMYGKWEIYLPSKRIYASGTIKL